nr:hypothetical protein CFP56_66807 [Quercus suber]
MRYVPYVISGAISLSQELNELVLSFHKSYAESFRMPQTLLPPVWMDDFDFTITLYYWGKIRNNPYRDEGGEVKIYKDNNSNEMSLVEIWNKAKNFRYDENDVFMYRVPTMPFAGGLKPLENDVDVMNMVKCIRGYNELEVYVMFLDDYENAIGNEGDGGGGDNEDNFNEGDKVDGAVSEEDSAYKVHFGCRESDDNDML